MVNWCVSQVSTVHGLVGVVHWQAGGGLFAVSAVWNRRGVSVSAQVTSVVDVVSSLGTGEL